MNNLIELIDSRIPDVADVINIVPCIVLELKEEQYVKVKLLSNNCVYTVLNESGSDVQVNEIVQLAYKKYLSDNSAYIIASKNKSTQSTSSNLKMDVYCGALFDIPSRIAEIGIKAMNATNCILCFNANVSAYNDTTIVYTIHNDNEIISFKPKWTVEEDDYICTSFTIPLSLNSGKHEIFIEAVGNDGVTLDIEAFIMGLNIEAYDLYDEVGDNDFIYIINNNKSDAIYYIGSSNRPCIPTTLENYPIDKLCSTAFNYSNIESVYIPEGITEIE